MGIEINTMQIKLIKIKMVNSMMEIAKTMNSMEIIIKMEWNMEMKAINRN